MTKFLVHGNSPTAKTGYGVQIRQLVRQLALDGHEPACSSTYGIDGGVENVTIEDVGQIRVYGRGYDTNSNDRLHMHAAHWFAGDPKSWLITCLDVWAVTNPLLKDMNVVAWTPVDHLPLQDGVREFFHRTGAVPVAMSRFGERMMIHAGLDARYVPLSVDTEQYKPTPVMSNGKTFREVHELPDNAFVVGMVAMNKGWNKDRKGFNEAFWAFAMFEKDHPDAYLYVHADKPGGAEGMDLHQLAILSGIPPHKIVWAGGPNQYGYYLTYTDEMMAAMYTSIDVLLAPSHGEGFCVPLIEAQACGTPVIATDFSAQSELVPAGVGWLIGGQPEYDPAHRALYKQPTIHTPMNRMILDWCLETLQPVENEQVQEVVELLDEISSATPLTVRDGLELAWRADRDQMAAACIEHAAEYNVDTVYQTYWRPLIAELTAEPEILELDREPMPEQDAVAVLVPIYKRTENMWALAASFAETTKRGEATLYFVLDEGDKEARDEYFKIGPPAGIDDRDPEVSFLPATGESCAAKWNAGFKKTTEPWVLCVGDDVRFHEGWLDAARKLSDRFDVIGTNDTADQIKNPKVANGSHADHFFVRRAYVDEYGASLDGPGVLACEDYRHWYVDLEIIKLARARGVFTPCLDSIVEHLHPGYDGDEDARAADPTYMVAVENKEADEKTYESRLPLIEMQRAGLAKV